MPDRTDSIPLPPPRCRYPRRIILVGLRGSGKSCVGRALARALGFAFVDLDRALVARAGATIAEIFAREGERGFRRREAALLAELAGAPPPARGEVWATGGGVVLRADNRRALRAAGAVVWLDAPPAECARRVLRDRRTRASRPSLTAATSPLAEMRALAAERAPRYAAASHLRVPAGGRGGPAAVARRVRTDLLRAVARTRAAVSDRSP